MNDFKVIYKILRFLDRNKGREDCDFEMISADTLKIPECRWEQLMIELQRNGYIDGVMYEQTFDDKFPHIAHPITPRITLKGMEYLETNSMMAKAGHLLGGVVNVAGSLKP